jgi:Mrp family chromosome partitioning ATPase
MGRLLEALKRLEPEKQAEQTAEPVVEVENRPKATSSTSGTAVLERPINRLEDSPEEINPPKSDSHQSFQPVEPLGGLSYEGISEKIENLVQLLESELPLCNFSNVVTEIPPGQEECAISTAAAVSSVSVEQTYIAEPETGNDQKVSLNDLALLQEGNPWEGEAPAEPNSTLLSPFSATLQIPRPRETFRRLEIAKPHVEKPETPKDPGVFGAMAQNILTQLPLEGSVTLFITSPTDGEGKTETILPLAEAMVEASGRRTILVDANLRCPDLTREWQFSSRRGLFDVLAGEADWWEAVQETGLSKLSILLNNGLPQPNSRISQPLAFSELLENLKKEYRLVLIDGASLAHAESISMVRHCHGVYLLVRLGHASPTAVRKASQIIAQAGGKLLGCIAVGEVLAPA